MYAFRRAQEHNRGCDVWGHLRTTVGQRAVPPVQHAGPGYAKRIWAPHQSAMWLPRLMTASVAGAA